MENILQIERAIIKSHEFHANSSHANVNKSAEICELVITK